MNYRAFCVLKRKETFQSARLKPSGTPIRRVLKPIQMKIPKISLLPFLEDSKNPLKNFRMKQFHNYDEFLKNSKNSHNRQKKKRSTRIRIGRKIQLRERPMNIRMHKLKQRPQTSYGRLQHGKKSNFIPTARLFTPNMRVSEDQSKINLINVEKCILDDERDCVKEIRRKKTAKRIMKSHTNKYFKKKRSRGRFRVLKRTCKKRLKGIDFKRGGKKEEIDSLDVISLSNLQNGPEITGRMKGMKWKKEKVRKKPRTKKRLFKKKNNFLTSFPLRLNSIISKNKRKYSRILDSSRDPLKVTFHSLKGYYENEWSNSKLNEEKFYKKVASPKDDKEKKLIDEIVLEHYDKEIVHHPYEEIDCAFKDE